jgi:hypothetical protein
VFNRVGSSEVDDANHVKPHAVSERKFGVRGDISCAKFELKRRTCRRPMLHLGGLSIPLLSLAHGHPSRSAETASSHETKGLTVRKEQMLTTTTALRNRLAKRLVYQPQWEPPSNKIGVRTENSRTPGVRCTDAT